MLRRKEVRLSIAFQPTTLLSTRGHQRRGDAMVDKISLPEGDVLTWPHSVLAELLALPEHDIPSIVEAARIQRERIANDGFGNFPEDPENLLEYARAWEGAANAYDDGDIPAEDADWRIEKEYPITALLAHMGGTREGWAEWFRTENKWAREDGRHGYHDLLLETLEEEVVLLELEGGRVDIWDGWHRIGAAITKGELTVCAVVGSPKPELKLAMG